MIWDVANRGIPLPRGYVENQLELQHAGLPPYLFSAGQLGSIAYWQLALSRGQIDNATHAKETCLNPQDLQGKYLAALARIGGTDSSNRQTPIFRREPAITEEQSVQDAAKALAALWKIAKP